MKNEWVNESMEWGNWVKKRESNWIKDVNEKWIRRGEILEPKEEVNSIEWTVYIECHHHLQHPPWHPKDHDAEAVFILFAPLMPDLDFFSIECPSMISPSFYIDTPMHVRSLTILIWFIILFVYWILHSFPDFHNEPQIEIYVWI